MKRVRDDLGIDGVEIADRTDDFACIGLWGPKARETLARLVDEPEALSDERFPFAAFREIEVAGTDVLAFRISYVGEQGWELHVDYGDGLALWDALAAEGVTPIGIETYANSRRLEKSLRLQNADLLTEYNLVESGLARPKVKAADFHGKEAYLLQREKERQDAYLCTLVMTENVDAKGVARFPVGVCPILDPESGETLVDARGRRSYTTSIAFGPSVGKNIALGYLPADRCVEGGTLAIEYFGERYPVEIAAVGYRPLYDAENRKPRS